MSFFSSFQISASGLTAQRLRMDVISSNLANINTTRTPEGGPYRRKDVVFEASQVDQSASKAPSFSDLLRSKVLPGVKVTAIIEDTQPPRMQYDPTHPDADENGYVQYPNINLVEEMVNMIDASRAYEANVTALNTAKNMALRALDIGV